MPQSRKQQKRKAAPAKYRGTGQPILSANARNDVIGVVLIALAIALFVALFSSSTAPITYGIHTALARGFGAGALLVPVALLLFGITFFVTTESRITGRAALGLSLILLAVLSMLSIAVPGADTQPSLVLQEPALSGSGGYVGSSIAWVLLTLVGRMVGIVILVGIIVAGVVICGFSITDFVDRMRERLGIYAEEARSMRMERRAAREEAAASAAAAAPAKASKPSRKRAAQATLFDENGEPATSYVGSRKTSVLKRGEAAVTTLLDRASGIGADVDEDTGAPEPVEDVADDRGAVPSFLDRGKKKAASGSKASKPKKKAAEKSDAPKQSAPKTHGDPDALPPTTLIQCGSGGGVAVSNDELAATAQRLQDTLEEFGLASRVTGWVTGPAVTTFKISMGEGERVNKITNLQDDIALSLAAKSVRIFAPIPGTSLVGIEIPNQETQDVRLGDVLPYVQGGPLDVAFGRNSEGKPVVVDLASLPHLLVAGTTGSGKSVLLNSIVMSMLMRATPEDVRLIMVDPKRVEFTYYAGLPHLYVPVVTEPRQAASALQWGVSEMERRLKVFEQNKVRDIRSYNKLAAKAAKAAADSGDEEADVPKHIPYFVIVIDELADLMMVAGKDVESSIVRIAQLGRAAGIHLIVATQRPSADVVTGLIKANIDNRVALSVDNGMNSRIILDQTGAERLLGHGDMLYKLRGKRPQRAQGCFVSEEEVESVVSFIKDHHESDLHEDILTAVQPTMAGGGGGAAGGPSDDDPLVWEAAQLVVESQLGSTSALQRHLKVGYARAGRIMDMLEEKGVVGPPDGSKPREVLLDLEGLEELRAADSQYKEV